MSITFEEAEAMERKREGEKPLDGMSDLADRYVASVQKKERAARGEEALAKLNAEKRAAQQPKTEAWNAYQAATCEAHEAWIAGYTGDAETREQNRARWETYRDATAEAWDTYLTAIDAYSTPPKIGSKPKKVTVG
jgi:selenocysteine-specific translation elongation factor